MNVTNQFPEIYFLIADDRLISVLKQMPVPKMAKVVGHSVAGQRACSELTLSGVFLRRAFLTPSLFPQTATVSQLKKYLCYDNFNFDKKRYGKLKKASVSDVFALVSVEIYL